MERNSHFCVLLYVNCELLPFSYFFFFFFFVALYEVLQLLRYSAFIHNAFDDYRDIEFYHSVYGVETGECTKDNDKS